MVQGALVTKKKLFIFSFLDFFYVFLSKVNIVVHKSVFWKTLDFHS